MKKVLMIAFHYPPCRGSSGIQRTLKFSRYLPDYGWQPIILTAHPKAYPRVGDDQIHEIRDDIVVRRAFSLDTSRHLSMRGAYAKWMALPDRWVSWWAGALYEGLRLIRQHQPDIIWSTYPIATAHLIGCTLHYLSGLPWVVDFRDSMTEDGYPRDAVTRQSYQWIEKRAISYGTRLVFTAASTCHMYSQRYPELCSERCLVIPNGYDEDDFKTLTSSQTTESRTGRPIRLLHAGLMYPEERDPRPFFRALACLKEEGQIAARHLQVDLRAAGSEEYYSAMIRELEIDDIVHLLPALPYQQSLQDCADADALLLFQAASCNHQIPAKAYEYLRLRKPILALAPAEGDTAALLRDNGGATIVNLHDEQAVYHAVPQFLRAVQDSTHPLPDNEKIKRYARHYQTSALAKCLYQLVDSRATS